MFPNRQIVLAGSLVSLIPMKAEHSASLFELAESMELWRWYPERIACHGDMAKVVSRALESREKGESLPFVTLANATNEIVGSTRYFNISKEHRRVEIGWTWIGPKWQRTGINVEAKYLMFKYAFENLDCIRVELKTDSRNDKSQRAMVDLGLVREGVLRSHMVTHDGSLRDTVYFSAIKREWPVLKLLLEGRMLR